MVVADDRLRGRVSSSRRGIKSVVTRESNARGKRKRERKRKITIKKTRKKLYIYIYISRFEDNFIDNLFISADDNPMDRGYLTV